MMDPTPSSSAAPPSKSFAEIVGKSTPASIPLKAPSSFHGEPATFFSEEDNINLSSPYQFSLVGKFSHERPSMPELKVAFETIGLKSSVSLGLLDAKHLLIRFTHEEDFHRVWLREMWYLKGFRMRIFKWTLDFRVDVVFNCSSWVNLHFLPVQFFAKESLLSICGNIGRPLKLNAATTVIARPSMV